MAAQPTAVSTPAEIRDWLRDLKARSGLSFADIAQAIGEEQRNVKRWMAKDAIPRIPAGDTLLRLLDALGVRLEPAPKGHAPGAVNTELAALRDQVRRIERMLEKELQPRRSTAKGPTEADRVMDQALDEIRAALERLVGAGSDQAEPAGGGA